MNSKETSLIIQLSDIHIGRENENTYDTDVRANFQTALSHAVSRSPDLIVVTGDIAFKAGDKNIYIWVKEKLDQTDLPYTLIAGNHDDSTLLAQSFNLTSDLHEGALYHYRILRNKLLFFLDTSSDMFDSLQQNFVTSVMEKNDMPAVLFMHHPPKLLGAKFMDARYSLSNIPEVKLWFNLQKNIEAVFCGHYHAKKEGTIANEVPIYVCPSTFFQIDPDIEGFKIENLGIGYREIILSENGISTKPVFINGH
jgi:Icc protein